MNIKYTLIVPALAILAIAVSLEGWATPPENIAPAYISELTYVNTHASSLPKNRAVWPRPSRQHQTRSAELDRADYILFVRQQYGIGGSRLKGKLQALQKAAPLKKCNLPLGLKKFMTSSVPVPSLVAQKKLSDLARKVAAYRHIQDSVADELKGIMPILLDRAFKGELQ